MASATIILALLSQAIYGSWLDRQWEGHLCAAFDPSPAPVVPNFVERLAVIEKVRRVIAATSTQYGVIIGNYGTGKSTVVQKIACETSGALYAFIRPKMDVESAVAKAIVEALGGPRPESFLQRIWDRLLAGEHYEPIISIIKADWWILGQVISL